MATLLSVLYKMKLLSPLGIGRLIAAIFKNGINVMTLLDFAARTYGEKIAMVDDQETISYRQLLQQSKQLSNALFQKYQLESGQKIGILCRNHISFVRSIFAVSRVGGELYLLNTEMSRDQLQKLLEDHQFTLLIYDSELSEKVDGYLGAKVLSNQLPKTETKPSLPRTSMGKLMLLTGGTTGKSKEVAHKPSLFHYLNPFLGLLTRLNLTHHHTVYIATPIYHGYGLAVLFLLLALGKKVIITNGFKAEKACELIRTHEVEVVTVVPLMIQRMLNHNPTDLQSLKCIASGSAPLSPKLVEEVSGKLGDILCNLYGTSEAGLNMIATPMDLKYSASTIGRKINGVRLHVLDRNKNQVGLREVGQFCIKNGKSAWIETGDLGYLDENGYYFLCGRGDDMIVSGGVNVYPIELERVLMQHPLIEDAAVIGFDDEQFGQRLKAFIKPRTDFSKKDILSWLDVRVARYQMPKEIVFIDEMPYTPLGKHNKKKLKGKWNNDYQ